MRFSHAWLMDYLGTAEEPAKVGERLTDAGIPLDGIERRGDDSLYDFDIFTNRPDCMNHLGLAREYAALTGTALRVPAGPIPPGGRPTGEVVTVTIEAPDLCARYAARCILGVRVGPSPDWLRRRLEAIGQRSINNVVDATNFVLWELGHPLHPFDLDRLDGKAIVVRRARAGETLRTLDGIDRTLSPEMLVIADAARPVALAGIMGGEASEIGERTVNVLLESAWFEPVPVRRAARALGLRTDASHRFERGADLEGVVPALDRAAHLIQKIAGGSVTSPALDACPRPHRERVVPFRPGRARALLGFELEEHFMRQALTRLGFTVGAGKDGAWSVAVPSFRRDVEREVDLIEEVARLRGYGAIPASLPILPGAEDGRSQADRTSLTSCRTMQAAGFSEAVNYAMVGREDCLEFAPEHDRPLGLTNPLQSNAAFLRTSLLPGLLRNTAHNLNHGIAAIQLFETGTVFLPASPLPRERRRLGFVLAGRGLPVHWSLPRRAVDLYDARGAVEVVADLAGIVPLTFSSDRIPFLEAGRALRVAGGARGLCEPGDPDRLPAPGADLDGGGSAGERRIDHGHPGPRAGSEAPRHGDTMNPNRTGRAEVRMESKRVVVDLQQLDLLESKIVKATELIRSLRKERDQAQGRVKDLEKSLAAAQAQLHASEKGKDELREITEQVDVLREERQAIRGRVSQMIEMMNGLEDGGGESRRDH